MSTQNPIWQLEKSGCKKPLFLMRTVTVKFSTNEFFISEFTTGNCGCLAWGRIRAARTRPGASGAEDRRAEAAGVRPDPEGAGGRPRGDPAGP